MMDLENISSEKLDYRNNVNTIEANPPKKRTNRLCMYGLSSTKAKMTQKRAVDSTMIKKDKGITQTVSFIASFFLKLHILKRYNVAYFVAD